MPDEQSGGNVQRWDYVSALLIAASAVFITGIIVTSGEHVPLFWIFSIGAVVTYVPAAWRIIIKGHRLFPQSGRPNG